MAITNQQKIERQKHIGSSDVAAILNLDPFRSAYDVFLEKSGKLEGEPKETPVITRGNFLEPALLDFAESILGTILRSSPEKYMKKESPVGFQIVSHPDGLTYPDNTPIEAKSQGAYSKETWGEEGTDQVPDRVIIQSEVHMLCYEAEICHVPAYLPYREFQMFAVKRDNDIIESILEAVDDFWKVNVLGDTPPEDSKPALSVIKRIRHIPDKTISIPSEVALNWDKARQDRLAAEKVEESHLTSLLAAIGQAEAGVFDGGMITLFSTERTIYKVPEEIRRQYAEITKYRTPRMKKENGK